MISTKKRKESKRKYYLKNRDKILEKCREKYKENREAKIAYEKKYREKNKKTIDAYQKEYRIKNKEKRRKSCREWHYKNKDRVKEYRKDNADYIKQWYRDYYKNNVQDRIARCLRARLNDALKGNSSTGSAVRDLGCSIEEFKKYIEAQWQEGMIWDNHGINGWHIDHIKPLASFDLTKPEELKKACHYTNLRPLWAKDNLSKGAKYDID